MDMHYTYICCFLIWHYLRSSQSFSKWWAMDVDLSTVSFIFDLHCWLYLLLTFSPLTCEILFSYVSLKWIGFKSIPLVSGDFHFQSDSLFTCSSRSSAIMIVHQTKELCRVSFDYGCSRSEHKLMKRENSRACWSCSNIVRAHTFASKFLGTPLKIGLSIVIISKTKILW